MDASRPRPPGASIARAAPAAPAVPAVPASPGRAAPTVIVLGGVAGSGKSTTGAALARRLGWRFADADAFHPAANVAKMAAGHPLTDADRQPWLAAIARWVDERITAGESAVVTCSALKRPYRQLLTDGRPRVRLVFLTAPKRVLAARMARRRRHFMKVTMLDSQLADLEPPMPDEGAVVVDATAPREAVLDAIVAAIRAH